MRCLIAGLLIAWFCSLHPQEVSAELFQYYVGRDTRATNVGGAYNGLANPNYNRLTFLYAHTYPATPNINHYHSKGAYSYTGTNLGAATAVNDFNGTFGVSNLLPESPLVNDIQLRPGSGLFSGYLISGLNPGASFNNLRIRSVDSLDGFPPESGEDYLHHSSGSRWSGSMAGSNISLQLLTIDSGLSILDAVGNSIFSSPGDILNLGNGSTIDFTPIFAVNNTAFFGQEFNATFKLIDSGTGNSGGPWLESGRFQFQVTAVPEPSSLAFLGTFGLGLANFRRRRHSCVH
jgi:hypothetical protein